MCILHLFTAPWCLGLNLILSKTIAAETALINNFIWNDIWTFRSYETKQNDWGRRFQRLIKFNFICLIGIALSVLLLHLQVTVFNVNIYLANFIAIVLVSIWNFWLNSRLNWRLKGFYPQINADKRR
jgi:dolichol-phosphate mannosyltransferase